MTKPNVGVDSAETINRFIAQMLSGSNTSSGSAVIPRQAALESVPEQLNDTVSTNRDISDRAGVNRSEPIDIPATRLSHSTTPNRKGPASPGHQATTSPHFDGLRAPHNTPKTNPASPRVSPGRSYDDELAEVSHVVSTIVGTLDTKPLSQSIWAPKSGEYHRPSLSAFSTPSRDLTPVRVVKANPAVNDSFTRMSFKAADSNNEIGRPLIGEHLYKSPPSKSASKQMRSIPSGSQKLEAEIVPIADRGIIKASRSAADGSPELRADANKVRFRESPLSETVKPLTFSNLIQKESAAAPRAHNSSFPPHSSTTSNSCLATIGSSVAQSNGLCNQPPPTVWMPQPTSDSSHMSSPTSDYTDEGRPHLNQQIPHASHCSEKSSPTSDGTDQGRFAFSQQIPTTTASNETYSVESTTPVPDNHLVDVLQKLESLGSLQPEESVLLADLTSRILRRTVGIKQSEASKAVGKISDMDLPNNFLDKWASKPKNTKENAGLPTKVTGAPSNHIVKPAAAPTVINEPSRALSESMEASQRPPLAAKASNSAAKPGVDTEDREHKTFFNAWPQLEQRDRPAAQIRTVFIKDLPRNATPSFVASVVYGGAIEWIFMRSDSSATVRFMDAKDCQNYYDDTSNGVVYGKDAQGRELVCFVELGKDVDVIGGLLRGWIDTGVTRCVKAVGVEEEFGIEALRKMGERKGRRVESLEDGKTPGGTRSVIWRFCKIDEAVQFKAALHRDEEWESCNIHYATDPCATATRVHFDK